MNSFFGVYSEIKDAERAVNELKKLDSTSDSISIIVKRGVINSYLSRYDNWPHFSSQVNIRRATISDLIALLLGVGARRLPDVGATVITGFLTSAFDNLDKGFVDVLTEMDTAEDIAQEYRQAVRDHEIVLAVLAENNEIEETQHILQETGAKMVQKIEMPIFEDS